MTPTSGEAEALVKRLQSFTPQAQEQVADLVERARVQTWHPWWCGRYDCDGKPHGEWTWRHARGDQHPPRWAWDVWIALSGRGAGKTRSGSEWTHRMTKRTQYLALVAPTAADARDTMVEGESGLLNTQDPRNPCVYEPSKRRITWANGARATLFTAEKPRQLRGPQHGAAWLDEGCFMANIEEVWSNLKFGMRLGEHPRVFVTTTPKPTKWLKELLADEDTARSTVSTYANLDNLAPTFRKAVLGKYEGTRTGRQEINAEILEDVEGALWSVDIIGRIAEAPPLSGIVVGLDPSGSAAGDEAGVVVVGRDGQGNGYVLEDLSGPMSPQQWAKAAVDASRRWGVVAGVPAVPIVAETNYGGGMVDAVLRTVATDVPIIPVTARVGKALRAEPVVALYEQRRIFHVGTLEDRERFTILEDQMTQWVPDESPESPDRVDALVHALAFLLVKAPPSQVSNPSARPSTIAGTYRGSGPVRRLIPGLGR